MPGGGLDNGFGDVSMVRSPDRVQSGGRDTRRVAAARMFPMMYSTTCSYAIRALCRLALIDPAGYVRIQEVCEGSALPSYFVAKIFRDLVRAGILKSAKGRASA